MFYYNPYRGILYVKSSSLKKNPIGDLLFLHKKDGVKTGPVVFAKHYTIKDHKSLSVLCESAAVDPGSSSDSESTPDKEDKNKAHTDNILRSSIVPYRESILKSYPSPGPNGNLNAHSDLPKELERETPSDADEFEEEMEDTPFDSFFVKGSLKEEDAEMLEKALSERELADALKHSKAFIDNSLNPESNDPDETMRKLLEMPLEERRRLYSLSLTKEALNEPLNDLEKKVKHFLNESEKAKIKSKNCEEANDSYFRSPLGSVIKVTYYFTNTQPQESSTGEYFIPRENGVATLFLQVTERRLRVKKEKLAMHLIDHFYAEGFKRLQPANVKMTSIQLKSVYPPQSDNFLYTLNNIDYGSLNENDHKVTPYKFLIALTGGYNNATRGDGGIRIPFVSSNLERYRPKSENPLFQAVDSLVTRMRSVIKLPCGVTLALCMETSRANATERYNLPVSVAAVGFNVYSSKRKAKLDGKVQVSNKEEETTSNLSVTKSGPANPFFVTKKIDSTD